MWEYGGVNDGRGAAADNLQLWPNRNGFDSGADSLDQRSKSAADGNVVDAYRNGRQFEES
jgi:hypothetical protein